MREREGKKKQERTKRSKETSIHTTSTPIHTLTYGVEEAEMRGADTDDGSREGSDGRAEWGAESDPKSSVRVACGSAERISVSPTNTADAPQLANACTSERELERHIYTRLSG